MSAAVRSCGATLEQRRGHRNRKPRKRKLMKMIVRASAVQCTERGHAMDGGRRGRISRVMRPQREVPQILMSTCARLLVSEPREQLLHPADDGERGGGSRKVFAS